jgi:osmotically-inducible protein OsmY
MTLERRILDELQNHSLIDTSRIRVTATADGLIFLEGVVHTYAEKCALEEDVRTVAGVSGVQNELEVRLTIGDYRTDGTLRRVLQDMLDGLARMPAERPRVSVVDGWVTLEGTVQHAFQKLLVEKTVREVAGVRGLTNRVEIEKERRALRPPLSSAIF